MKECYLRTRWPCYNNSMALPARFYAVMAGTTVAAPLMAVSRGRATSLRQWLQRHLTRELIESSSPGQFKAGRPAWKSGKQRTGPRAMRQRWVARAESLISGLAERLKTELALGPSKLTTGRPRVQWTPHAVSEELKPKQAPPKDAFRRELQRCARAHTQGEPVALRQVVGAFVEFLLAVLSRLATPLDKFPKRTMLRDLQSRLRHDLHRLKLYLKTLKGSRPKREPALRTATQG